MALLLLSRFSRVRPQRWQSIRLPCPWDSPSKNTGVDCHFLLQCIKVKSESEVSQSCPTHSDPVDCTHKGLFAASHVGSSWTRYQNHVSCMSGRFFTIWRTGKFLENTDGHFNRQSWWICDAWKDVYFLPGLSWIWLLVQRSDVGVGLWLCSGLRLNAVLRVPQELDLYNNNMCVMPTWKGWRAMWSMTVLGPRDSVLSMQNSDMEVP